MLERIICVVIGYVCGLFQTAYIYGRLKHIDIREHGSGNAGTTNALRTLGKKAGLYTFLGDFLKPMVASLIVWIIFRGEKDVVLLELYAGVAAVFGHVFPCYLKFRGGKGIATTAGTMVWFCISAGCWYVLPVLLVFFVAVVAITRYVSVGSILLVSACCAWVVYLGMHGAIALSEQALIQMYCLIGIFTLLTIVKHRTNILRLVKGTENKIFAKKEK